MTGSGIEIVEQVPLSPKNSFTIGGNARYYCAPQSTEQLKDALSFAASEQLPLQVIGNGSNLLISDRGWPGLVVHLTSGFNGGEMQWNDGMVSVTGAVSLGSIVKASAERGFRGMEDLAGIPGTVGGAVIMNAGAFSACIADTLESVRYLRPSTGEIQLRHANALQLTYRSSALKGSGDIVLSARFRFSRTGNPAEIHARRLEILDRRKSKQPLDYPNCGSVFKRPPGNYAGTLIEKCGLKGLRCGGAEVSEKHANFIINIGNAAADDVRHLIYTIQKHVFEQHSILLEPEVIFVGPFDEPLYVPAEITT
jgi:UDP-N-acetylmuramate dehydrogenase